MLESVTSKTQFRLGKFSFRLALAIVLLGVLGSCGSGFSVSRKHIYPIDNSFSGSFYNESKEGFIVGQVYLTDLFLLPDTVAVDVVHLSFVDSTHLVIACFDSADVGTNMEWGPDFFKGYHCMMKGQFSKNRFFETSWSDKNNKIPWYWYDHTYARIRLGIMKDGRLIVDFRLREVICRWGKSEESEINRTYYFKPTKPIEQSIPSSSNGNSIF